MANSKDAAVEVDTKLLEALVMQLGQINANLVQLTDRVDKFVFDLNEFSERFEEVVGQLENERRLDVSRDYD